ncbi:MAG TPA: single-stranded DNA-binding protein [Thermoanaerobaculia bacterium]|nr:single-stranded DNA-binding protein [Thermoanaerobaculia bacterium]
MSGSVNRVILVGRLGKDPEVRSTPSGTTVARFSLATDERFTDKSGERQERTEWHNIVAFNKLADICGQYLRKGKLVFIEGSIRSDSWDDKETGQKRYKTEIIAQSMQMLGPKGEGERSGSYSGGSRQPVAAGAAADTVMDGEEEVPF